MDVGGGERVAFGGGDPGVEGGVVGPHRDDDGVAVAGGRFADQFGQDAVGLADGTALGDPGQVAVADVGGDVDGAQADDHAGSVTGSGSGTLRNQRHSVRS